MKVDFLSEEKKFQKSGRILLKRGFWRIEPCQNIAFRCSGKSGVRFARSVRTFLVVLVSGPLKNSILVLGLSNLDFQIQFSILNLKNLVSRCETQKGRDQGYLFENLIFFTFQSTSKFFDFSDRKKVSKKCEGHIFVISTKFSIEQAKKTSTFFFTTTMPQVHLINCHFLK